MKNIKNYLIVALSIAFCTSLYMIAMESFEKSNKSGESLEELPTGMSSESGESGAEVNPYDQRILKARIERLKIFYKELGKIINDKEFSINQKDAIQRLQKNIQDLIRLAYEMYFGAIPVVMPYINEQVEFIVISMKKYF